MSELLARRSLLLYAGATALYLPLSGFGRTRRETQQQVEVVDVLQAAFNLEEETVSIHHYLHDTRLLGGSELSLCEKMRMNHQRHSARLKYWIESLAVPVKPFSDSRPKPSVHTREEALAQAAKLERTLIDTYLAHAADLSGEMLADAVSILKDETRHHTLISAWLRNHAA
ncbi:MAG: ferritin-like domain-containing protein [Acidobacteria bacterium]|nr:ferritin-like domain-containing protein [Acidobacteriota bacterium]